MRKIIASFALFLCCCVSQAAIAGPKVEFKTSMGNFVVELDEVKAPKQRLTF